MANSTAFKKGEKRPNQGRPAGSLSKTTKTAKEAIALAAEGLGGISRLIAWAQEDPLNERAFWSSIYPKLLPLQVSGPGENGEHLFQQIERRIVNAGH
jgi:hypothetical protein